MALGPHGGMGFGGATGQQQNPYYSPNSLLGLVNQAVQPSCTASHPKPDTVKVEYPERGVHDHLQRRVNKWLKGIELPMH